MNVTSLFQILGGVGLFLYGIKLMSDALQDLAGDRLRTLIASLTSTPLKGVLIGTLVTMVIQSSSATTVMSVSFVQAGLMTLRQALGVIMGANIGTTITGQLIAFNISDLALPTVGVGMLLAVFGRSRQQRYIGNGIFGFGLLFIGMNTMEASMSFMRSRQDIFLAFAHNPLLGVLAGTVLTMIVQSSSATVGLTIAMAIQGLLPLEAALPILLGDNLGTTITAVIASLGSSRAAKQAAAGHVIIKLVGICYFLPFMTPFMKLVTMTSSELPRQIANAHTIFNVLNTLVMMPFTDQLVKIINKLIPLDETESYTGPRYLDERLLNASPAAAVSAVRSELLGMGQLATQMLDLVNKAFLMKDDSAVEKLNQIERVVNELTHQIASYAAKLWQRHISADLSKLLASYVNGASDIERIGDHAQNMMELYTSLVDHNLEFSDTAKDDFENMFSTVREMVVKSIHAVETEQPDLAHEVADTLEDKVDFKEQTLRQSHIQRLNEGLCAPASGIIFIDLLSNMERIGDHAHNLSLIVMDITRMHKTGS